VPTLNERQARFVAEYLLDLNATQAAVRAGYSPRSARQVAGRMMTNDDIAAAIAEAQAVRSRRTEVTQDRVVLELARLAFGDPRRVMSWGPGGVKLRPSAELSDEEAAIVAEASQTVTENGGTIRLKVCEKLGALRLLAQHLGMLGEGKVAVTLAPAPELAGLQAVLLAVLERHPDAKRAVVAALEGLAHAPVGHA
jgi:phage terminase small subunit